MLGQGRDASLGSNYLGSRPGTVVLGTGDAHPSSASGPVTLCLGLAIYLASVITKKGRCDLLSQLS